jgi:soluble lytic murein transglycosylase-like protein
MNKSRCRLLLIISLFMLISNVAYGQIYHYRNSDGSTIYTSYVRCDLEFVEVIGGEEPSASACRTSSNRSREISRSIQTHAPSAYDAIIREAAVRFDLPFALIKAVIRAESAFNSRAVSRAGAQGLMQLMPGTADYLGVSDSFDPSQNIMGGSRYLRQMSDLYDGQMNLILSAYNAGPGRVAEYEGVPFSSTRRYIERVYRYYLDYMSESD